MSHAKDAGTEPADLHQCDLTRIKAIAFLCGASLMGLEMAGMRILEPHFGTTIYVWGSIIGIFLGALSLGYWVGGLLADRHPRLTVLGSIVLGAGLLTFIIPWIGDSVSGSLRAAEALGPRSRVLLASIILFGAPSILMGMVSPFAVRLATRRISGVGSVAGGLYAVSTLGSIAGTFLVSFVLTEVLGSKMIVFGIATLLVLVSVICFAGRLRGTPGLAVLTAGLLAFPGWVGASTPNAVFRYPDAGDGLWTDGRPADRLLDIAESPYHHIAVTLSRSLLPGEERARLMLFNNQVESGVLMSEDGSEILQPIQSACGYTRLLHLGTVFTQQAPRRVLVIGCGGGVGPQIFARDYAGTVELIDVVDIDPMVFELATKWFGYPAEDPIIKSHPVDGRLFLDRSSETWDYIILDAYTSGGRIPRPLITREFFELVQSRLAPGGVLAANIIGALNGDESQLFRAVWKTMDHVFENVYAFPRYHNPRGGENILMVATDQAERLDSYRINRNYLKIKGSVLKRPGLDEIVDRVITTAPKHDDVPLLTDDFCPTDSMVLN